MHLYLCIDVYKNVCLYTYIFIHTSTNMLYFDILFFKTESLEVSFYYDSGGIGGGHIHLKFS